MDPCKQIVDCGDEAVEVYYWAVEHCDGKVYHFHETVYCCNKRQDIGDFYGTT